MKSCKNSATWCNDIPIECVSLAKRRTKPLLKFFGHHIEMVTLEQMASSCYLQGIEDAMNYFDKVGVEVRRVG